MQATVRTYDPETRSGTLLYDDGTQARFSAQALDDAGLLMLRSGQRVFVRLASSGEVAAVSIWI